MGAQSGTTQSINSEQSLTHSLDLTEEQDDMNDTPERWLPIPGYEGRYDVSDLGRVRSWVPHNGTPLPRMMRPARHSKRTRHLCVSLTTADHVRTTKLVHVAVIEAFVGPRPDGLETRHLNGNATDNRRVNLAYGTPAENTADSLRHGTNYASNRTHCPQRHPYDEANTIVGTNPNGRPKRSCRICRDVSSRASAARKRAVAKAEEAA